MKIKRFILLINIKEEICFSYEMTILIFAYKYAFQWVRHMAYFTRDCYIFVHTDKKGKIAKAEDRNLGDDAADEQGMSESTLFIKAEFYL